jgi:hypothetical protein
MTTTPTRSTATHAATPLELLGAQPGLTVVDPSTALQRPWWFDGRYLRAEGFRADQQYVRALVALSNQAGGHGVVHGLDVEPRGAAVRVGGGLAVAPSGRVILLPSAVELRVDTLLARSGGQADPAVAPASGTADFGRCAPVVAGDDAVVVPSRPLYLLSVAAADALCGEEERFGRLCADACVTDSDRSDAVDGVRFVLRELVLSLPVSARVPFDERHLRSQVATAYFDAERRAVQAMVSGAGLRSSVWCAGAAGVGGEEVPLAVLARTGTVTAWVDGWIARRERIETTPHRTWAWRLAMRPWDVFLAQVLQFQCQLVDAPGTPGGPGTPADPCSGERSVLREAEDVLGSFTATIATKERADTASLAAVQARLGELRTRISDALAGPSRPATGSLLLDWGHVTVPPCGYLPVDPARPVEGQARALFGPGVDLRFCAVRPDVVGEAFHEAQHGERISLTQGVDDPGRLEEVDVLVPGGVVGGQTAELAAYDGRVRILPGRRRDGEEAETGAVLTLAAVARQQAHEQSQGDAPLGPVAGWSWTLAGFGEVPQRLAVRNLTRAVLGDALGGVEEDDVGGAAPLPLRSDAEHEALLTSAGFTQRLTREGVLARERHERFVGLFPEPGDAGEVADRPVPAAERRPVALWVDVEADRDLRAVAVGDRTPARLRVTTYSRASTEPFLQDLQLAGFLVVTASKPGLRGPGGEQLHEVTTEAVGVVDTLVISGGQVQDEPPRAVRGVVLRWQLGRSGDPRQGTRVISVAVERSAQGMAATFQAGGQPEQINGVLTVRRVVEDRPVLDPRWLSLGPAGEPRAAADESLVRLADLDLTADVGALAIGSPGRSLGEAVISAIGTELAVRGRDDGFTLTARRRLFEPGGGDDGAVRGTADWVFFHRRRTRTCGGAVERPPTIRRFGWLHAVTEPGVDLGRFAVLAGRFQKARLRGDLDAIRVRERLDDLGFEPVTTVEFAEQSTEVSSSTVALRAAFSAAPRGTHLVAGVAAAPPTSDGPHIDLGRLTAVTRAVSDLVDTSGMRMSTLSAIPPEFAQPGLDGVLFTVGTTPTLVRTTRGLLVRLRSDIVFGRGVQELTRQVLRDMLDGELDAFVGEWAETSLVNRVDVQQWWGAPAVKASAWVGRADVAPGSPDEAHLQACANELTALLQSDSMRRHSRASWRDEETEVLVLLLASG